MADAALSVADEAELPERGALGALLFGCEPVDSRSEEPVVGHVGVRTQLVGVAAGAAPARVDEEHARVLPAHHAAAAGVDGGGAGRASFRARRVPARSREAPKPGTHRLQAAELPQNGGVLRREPVRPAGQTRSTGASPTPGAQ